MDSINHLKARYEQLQPQDRRALAILALCLSLLVLFYGILLPAHKAANSSAEHHKERAELLAWMQARAPKVKALAQQSAQPSAASSEQSLLSIASSTAQDYQLSFKRFEPQGDKTLRLWLEKVPFNQLLLWLDELEQRYGLAVSQINIDRQATAGIVNVRLVVIGT